MIRRIIPQTNCSYYRSYLEQHAEEWKILDSLCYITISRFYRDRKVFGTLQHQILPRLSRNALIRNRVEIRCWSMGCCSGEEPYTLQILWHLDLLPKLPKQLPFKIIATDRRPDLISRAKRGQYPQGNLKELPTTFLEKAFIQSNSNCILKGYLKTGIRFSAQDIRQQLPEGNFDLILCRNLVFTYFQHDLQSRLSEQIFKRLTSNGFLVLGANESLKSSGDSLTPYSVEKSIYWKKKS